MKDNTIYGEQNMVRLSDGLEPLAPLEDDIPARPSLDFASQSAGEEYITPAWLKDINVSAVCLPYPFALPETAVDREAQIRDLVAWARGYSIGSHDSVMFRPLTNRRSTYDSIECVFSAKVTEAVIALQRGQNNFEHIDSHQAFELSKEQKTQLVMGALASQGVEHARRRIGGWVQRRRARFEFEAERTHATAVLYDVYRNDYLRGGDVDCEILSLEPDVTSTSIVKLLEDGRYDEGYAGFLELPQASAQDAVCDIASTRIFVQLLRHETTQEGLDTLHQYIASYKEISEEIIRTRWHERWCERNARVRYHKKANLGEKAQYFRKRIPELQKKQLDILSAVLGTGYEVYRRSAQSV